MAKKNVISLAKSGTATVKKPAARKPAAKKPEVKEMTSTEIRDKKATAKVKELLQDVDLSPEKKNDLFELDETHDDKSVEWLEEQVKLLSKKNESLRIELGNAKEDYKKIFGEMQQIKTSGGATDDAVKNTVIKIFNELQDNHVQRGTEFIIHPVAFMNRLIKFFPFLTPLKKY